jgi:hypothetical protein
MLSVNACLLALILLLALFLKLDASEDCLSAAVITGQSFPAFYHVYCQNVARALAIAGSVCARTASILVVEEGSERNENAHVDYVLVHRRVLTRVSDNRQESWSENVFNAFVAVGRGLKLADHLGARWVVHARIDLRLERLELPPVPDVQSVYGFRNPMAGQLPVSARDPHVSSGLSWH